MPIERVLQIGVAAQVALSTLLLGMGEQSVTLTLANVAIDDFAFGVASVSADGFESPVVFPGAAGAFWAP